MNALLVLIMIQMAGVVLAFGVSAVIQAKEHRKTFISEDFADTIAQRGEDWQWLIDYFQQQPKSSLRTVFPYLYNVAMATKQYKELNRLKDAGRISEKRYEKRLKKILSRINIKVDFEAARRGQNFLD